MSHFGKRFGIALLLCIPFFSLAHIAALLSTPLWWRVEAWTGWELAGGHGPSEELLIGFWIMAILAAFLTAFRPKRGEGTHGKMEIT